MTDYKITELGFISISNLTKFHINTALFRNKDIVITTDRDGSFHQYLDFNYGIVYADTNISKDSNVVKILRKGIDHNLLNLYMENELIRIENYLVELRDIITKDIDVTSELIHLPSTDLLNLQTLLTTESKILLDRFPIIPKLASVVVFESMGVNMYIKNTYELREFLRENIRQDKHPIDAIFESTEILYLSVYHGENSYDKLPSIGYKYYDDLGMNIGTYTYMECGGFMYYLRKGTSYAEQWNLTK